MARMNMTLDQAMKAYDADRRAKNMSVGTRRNEMAVLRSLMTDIGNINVRSIRPQHLDSFWQSHQDWSPGTFNRVKAHLNCFFQWCRARGYMDPALDPMVGVRSQTVPQRRRVTIPQSQFTTVIESRIEPRQRITFAIGLYAFLRISETQNLRWQNIDFDNRKIEVYRPKTKTLDILPICEELAEELHRWHRTYRAMAGMTIPGWSYVVPGMTAPSGYAVKGEKGFAGNKKRELIPTKEAHLGGTLRSGLEDLGYYLEREGGHTLRRSGAIALYNQLSSVGHDRSIRTCQAMLGHGSIKTTEIYLRLDLDRKSCFDLLAGKPMFPPAQEATVIQFERGESQSGTSDGGVVPL